MQPVCFLHIGTHKTGTTSLQTLLSSNEQCLERNGIYIPKSGRPWPAGGHHNLAWELNRDQRFNPSHGSFRDVVDEIRSRNPPVVCISSEDFEYLYRVPESLSWIKSEMRSIGYQVRIVIYLRSQAEYVESLYAELVKHGLHLGFREFLGQIVRYGVFVFRDFWTFAFDYQQLLDAFAKVFGNGSMIVRPYSANRPSNYLLDDLVSIISSEPKTLGLEFIAKRQHPSLSFVQVAELLLANRLNSEGNFEPEALSMPAGRFLAGPFDPLDLRDLMRIRRRFRETNKLLLEKYQVKVSAVSWRRLLRELKCTLRLDQDSARRKDLLLRIARDRVVAPASGRISVSG